MAHPFVRLAPACFTCMLAACDTAGSTDEGGESESETGDPASCDTAINTVSGNATFDGEAATFDSGSVTVYTNGPIDQPCLKFIEIGTIGETSRMDFYAGYAEDGATLELSRVGYGEPIVPDLYGAQPDELPKFMFNLELGPLDQPCTQVDFDVTGTNVGFYLDGTDDPTTYVLTEVNTSVAGTWTVMWLDEGVCGND